MAREETVQRWGTSSAMSLPDRAMIEIDTAMTSDETMRGLCLGLLLQQPQSGRVKPNGRCNPAIVFAKLLPGS